MRSEDLGGASSALAIAPRATRVTRAVDVAVVLLLPVIGLPIAAGCGPPS